MEKMEYIDILKLLEAIRDFFTDPQNEEKQRAFEELRQKITVKSTLPLLQKGIVIKRALLDIATEQENDEDGLVTSINFEKFMTFDVLLAYSNIGPEIENVFKDAVFYDMLWESGVCDDILKYCERDYNKTVDLIYRELSWENTKELVAALKNLSTESIEGLTKEFKEFKANLDPDLLNSMLEITGNGDPLLQAVRDGLDEGILSIVKTAQQKEKSEEIKEEKVPEE